MSNVLTSSTSPLPTSWIERLFHKMLLDYGKKFTDQWGGADTQALIDHWSVEMAGYAGHEIKRGLSAMEGRDWPPTLPEFKKMCRPPIDPLVAYYEAVAGAGARNAGEMGIWSHPAIFWAAMPLSFDLCSQTYSQIRTRWENALGEQFQRGEWPAIPQPMLALEAPGKSKMSRENAAQMLSELSASGITKKTVDGIDHRRWAKRIIQRIANGDKSVSMIQAQFAKEAMEAPLN